jgi:hypothetical protein
VRIWWILLCAAGCEHASVLDFSRTHLPVAVGATFSGTLSSRTCDSNGCDTHPVEVIDMDISPAGVFDTPFLGDRDEIVSTVALAEGTATLTITATDGDATQTFVEELTAVAANRVTGTMGYGASQLCATPAIYAQAVAPQMPYEIWRDDTKLFDTGLVPFASDGVPIDGSFEHIGTLYFELASEPGTTHVTSPIDPSFGAEFSVIAPAAIDAMSLSGPDEPLHILDEGKLRLDVLAAGQPVCADNITRVARTQTPTVCKLAPPNPRDEWASPGMREISVAALAAGICTIEVTQAGLLPAQVSFDVTM